MFCSDRWQILGYRNGAFGLPLQFVVHHVFVEGEEDCFHVVVFFDLVSLSAKRGGGQRERKSLIIKGFEEL